MKTKAQRIWQAFRDAEFTEDDEIVEHAALALCKIYSPVQIDLPILRRETPKDIIRLLRGAVGRDPTKAGQLLENIVEARLASKGESGQFASSKSVRDILYALLDIEPHHDLLDPACGTGRLLATRGRASGQTVGYETSPRWAFIATALCALNGVSAHIHVGDVFESPADKYDRIICNPPFGTEAAPKEWRWAFGGEKIRREAPFLDYMLRALRTDEPARAAALVSDGLLSGTDNGSLAFRRELTGSGHVRACVSLPPAVLGGSSSVECSAILMTAASGPYTWLVDASQATAAAIAKFLATMEDHLRWSYDAGEGRLTRIFGRQQQDLVVETTFPSGETGFTIFPRTRRGTFRNAPTFEERAHPLLLHIGDYCERGAVAMYAENRILALAFVPEELASNKCQLSLRGILQSTEKPLAAPRDPVALINALMTEQRNLLKELTGLAQMLENRPERSMYLEALPDRALGNGMSKPQLQVWQQIESHMVESGRPLEFNVIELQRFLPHLHSRQIGHALEVFETMGLLVRVADKYRVAATSDLWSAP